MDHTKICRNMQKNKPQNNFKKLIPYLKPYKVQIILAFIALLTTATMILLFGKIIKYLIDYGFSQNNENYIAISLICFISSIIIMSIAGYYRSFLVNSIAEKIIAKIRRQTYEHIIKVSPEFFETSKTGDIISRLTSDTTLLYSVISNNVSFFLRNSIFFIGGIILLFFTSAKLSVISLLLIPLAVAPIIILGKKVKKYSTKSQSILALLSSRIEESISGIKTIQAYNIQNRELENYQENINQYLGSSLKKIRVKSLMVALVITFAFSIVAIVLYIGGQDVLNNKITSGDLSSFIFYSIIISTSLASLGQIAGQFQSASASLNRIFELLEITSTVKEKSNPKDFIISNKIKINFDNIDFSYQQDLEDKPSFQLRNFNLEIKPQEKIAIIGPSGSGKSTIFQLLLRFYDVKSGKILLNNENIKDISLATLRNCFSYISQDCFIFSDTIFNNISYLNDKITKDDVKKIIDDNDALKFINNLPQGLNSFVGYKGTKLSGGEKQRIAIARAIIKDAPILLLDEATSALDNENEKIISDLINKVAKNKTLITIAHKLSTISDYDKIIYLQDGQIAEIGSHRELITNNSFYKNLYNK